ncbi:WW domain binding protein VOPP1 isoform X7 [Pan paniscus]|uniref:WW domain binding protein VOPP1 isoform X7 n=1 Tax=Pan paniscus TaxID=9597 RepID=UPI0030067E50
MEGKKWMAACCQTAGCRSYEDCCGSRCCVRALSIQRLWYFWFLLMMGVLFCCGAGFFIRRRMYPPPLIEEPAFNVSYTRQPPNPGPALLHVHYITSKKKCQKNLKAGWNSQGHPSQVHPVRIISLLHTQLAGTETTPLRTWCCPQQLQPALLLTPTPQRL